MFLSSFFSHFRLPNRRNAQFRCKVTTKNAHTQENEHFFWKKIDFIYQLRYYLCARWEFTHKRVYRWWLNEVAQPCFQKRCENYGVSTNFVSEWGERRHRSPYCWGGQRSMRSDCRTRVVWAAFRERNFEVGEPLCIRARWSAPQKLDTKLSVAYGAFIKRKIKGN